jgi:hypothetical protein
VGSTIEVVVVDLSKWHTAFRMLFDVRVEVDRVPVLARLEGRKVAAADRMLLAAAPLMESGKEEQR